MAVIDLRNTGGRRPGPDRKLSLQQELDLITDWNAGMKMKPLTEKHKVSKPIVYQILDRHGVQRAKKKAPASHEGKGAGTPPTIAGAPVLDATPDEAA